MRTKNAFMKRMAKETGRKAQLIGRITVYTKETNLDAKPACVKLLRNEIFVGKRWLLKNLTDEEMEAFIAQRAVQRLLKDERKVK
jgi:hypothetical protein